jgi:hypothetical protein
MVLSVLYSSLLVVYVSMVLLALRPYGGKVSMAITAVMRIRYYFLLYPDSTMALISDPNLNPASFNKDIRVYLIVLKAQDHYNFVKTHGNCLHLDTLNAM